MPKGWMFPQFASLKRVVNSQSGFVRENRLMLRVKILIHENKLVGGAHCITHLMQSTTEAFWQSHRQHFTHSQHVCLHMCHCSLQEGGQEHVYPVFSSMGCLLLPFFWGRACRGLALMHAQKKSQRSLWVAYGSLQHLMTWQKKALSLTCTCRCLKGSVIVALHAVTLT